MLRRKNFESNRNEELLKTKQRNTKHSKQLSPDHYHDYCTVPLARKRETQNNTQSRKNKTKRKKKKEGSNETKTKSESGKQIETTLVTYKLLPTQIHNPHIEANRTSILFHFCIFPYSLSLSIALCFSFLTHFNSCSKDAMESTSHKKKRKAKKFIPSLGFFLANKSQCFCSSPQFLTLFCIKHSPTLYDLLEIHFVSFA